MDRTNETDMVIKVTGNQWYWNYTYPDEGISFDSYMIDEAELKEPAKRVFCRLIIQWLCLKAPK